MRKDIYSSLFLLLLFYSISLSAFAQDESDNLIYTSVDQMPTYPGGMDALMNHVRTNLVVPEAAKAAGVNGRLFIGFTIGKDGNVSDIKVEKGLGFGLDEEAARVVSLFRRFEPGRQNGKLVKVRFILPIKITLETSDPADKQPEFPGGPEAIYRFLQKRAHFSKDTRDLTTPITLVYSIYISQSGKVTDVKVVRGRGFGIDETLQAALKKLPAWSPGQRNGKPADMSVLLPVVLDRKGRNPLEVVMPEAK